MSRLSIEHHQPYQRIMRDESTAADRQWLRMLDDALADIDLNTWLKIGGDIELINLIALRRRNDG